MTMPNTYQIIRQLIAIISAFWFLITNLFAGEEMKKIQIVNALDQAMYTLVMPEDAEEEVLSAAQALKEDLDELSKADFDLKTDSQGQSRNEILIGKTSRPESTKAFNKLADHQYLIGVDGSKVLVIGGSDEATIEATQAFVRLFEYDNKFELPAYFELVASIKTGFSDYLIGAANQGESKIEVYDIGEGSLDKSSLLWSFKTHAYNIAGLKLRRHADYGQVALAVYGSKHAAMISYPTGKILWSTKSAANNPHSIELLPGDIIAVASSTGNAIRFFNLKGASSKYTEVEFADAHGVLWDSSNQVLWALGKNVLTAFTVTKGTLGKIEVAEAEEYRSTVPTNGGHNLSPVYGDENGFWVSSSSKVYKYDKLTKEFSLGFDGSDDIIHSKVKAMGNFSDGSLLLTTPDGDFRSWTTAIINFYQKDGDTFTSKPMASTTGAFYKARIWCEDYQ